MSLEQLLQNAFLRREVLFSDEENSCFRLFNSEGDGKEGLSIDLYNTSLLIQYFDHSLVDQLQNIADISVKLLSSRMTVERVFAKNRADLKKSESIEAARTSRLLYGGSLDDELIVRHNGISLAADLINSQNPGVFMDMREVRDDLVSFYPDMRTMLNLFCYTGAFSVHGLLHGIKQVCNVDLSKPVLERAKKNYGLNGLSFDNRDFIKEDARVYLKWCIKKGITFDFVIFDPPTFARNKKGYFSVKTSYPEYLELIKQVTNGYLLSAINTYTVEQELYDSFHRSDFKFIKLYNEASDFVFGNKPYLKCALWQL